MTMKPWLASGTAVVGVVMAANWFVGGMVPFLLKGMSIALMVPASQII